MRYNEDCAFPTVRWPKDPPVDPPLEPETYQRCNRCDWESERSRTKELVKFCPNCLADGEEVKLQELPVKCEACHRVRCECDAEVEFL